MSKGSLSLPWDSRCWPPAGGLGPFTRGLSTWVPLGFLGPQLISMDRSPERREPGSCILLMAWPESHGASVLLFSLGQANLTPAQIKGEEPRPHLAEESQSSCKSIEVAIFENTIVHSHSCSLLPPLLLQDEPLPGSPSSDPCELLPPQLPRLFPDTSGPAMDKTRAQAQIPAVSHVNTGSNTFFVLTLHRRRSIFPRPGGPGRGVKEINR